MEEAEKFDKKSEPLFGNLITIEGFLLNPYSKDKEGVISIVGFSFVGVGISHPEFFVDWLMHLGNGIRLIIVLGPPRQESPTLAPQQFSLEWVWLL